MSNAMYPWCVTCNKGPVDLSSISNGADTIQYMYECLDLISRMYEIEDIMRREKHVYIAFPIISCQNEMLDFMLDHKDHDLWCRSEYGFKHESSFKLIKKYTT